MSRKLARAAATAAITGACLGGAQAAQAATVNVPCSAATLAAAMSSASTGDTLSLAAGCIYRQADLPAVTHDLTIDGNGATLKDSGLSVTAGTLTVTNLDFRRAQIVVTLIGNLTVNGGTFSGNTTAGNGGAIDINAPGAGDLSVTGATFTGNTAAGDGGAIFGYDYAYMIITDCTFTGNHAGGDGGAILANPDGETILSGDVIRGNTATSGGGIYNDATMRISGSRITGNHASGQGGALFTSFGDGAGPGEAVVTGSVIRGNSAQDGGAIYNFEGTVDLTSSTLAANYASDSGGGIYNDGRPLAQVGAVDLTDSKVSRNDAGGLGGGIYDSQWQVTASGTTITRNRAGTGGGGIYADGPTAAVTLTASSVLNNRPDNCEPADTITGCTS